MREKRATPKAAATTRLRIKLPPLTGVGGGAVNGQGAVVAAGVGGPRKRGLALSWVSRVLSICSAESAAVTPRSRGSELLWRATVVGHIDQVDDGLAHLAMFEPKMLRKRASELGVAHRVTLGGSRRRESTGVGAACRPLMIKEVDWSSPGWPACRTLLGAEPHHRSVVRPPAEHRDRGPRHRRCCRCARSSRAASVVGDVTGDIEVRAGRSSRDPGRP